MVQKARAHVARRFIGGMLVAVALGGAAPLPPHDPASCARPALWVVSDADTTIYLFGTIHSHDGRGHWFGHAIRRAFDASNELVLETVAPARLPPLAAPPGSGMAAARATIATGRSLGMRPDLGADRVLARAAERSNKPVIGLEPFAEQLRLYAALPAASPSAAPTSSTAEPDVAPFLAQLLESWNRGDPRPIEAAVGSVRAHSNAQYRRLFADRNEAWARWIGRRMLSPGTVFVAVGSGHLVGADSLQARLAAQGIRSARIG